MNRPIRRDPSYQKNLADYVKRNLKKSYPLESLKWALINQGHSRIEVDKAMVTAQTELAKEAPVLKITQVQDNQIEPKFDVQVEPKPSFWKKLFG